MTLTETGVFKVKHPQRETPFMLSVVKGDIGYAVRGFELDETRPAQGKHYLLTDNIRNWLQELELVKE